MGISEENEMDEMIKEGTVEGAETEATVEVTAVEEPAVEIEAAVEVKAVADDAAEPEAVAAAVEVTAVEEPASEEAEAVAEAEPIAEKTEEQLLREAEEEEKARKAKIRAIWDKVTTGLLIALMASPLLMLLYIFIWFMAR